MTGPMPLERFWAVVAEVGWATRQTQSTGEGRRFLTGLLSREEAVAFDERLQALRFSLHDVLDDWAEQTGAEFETGDDGFDDLVCHIIGLGREEYETVLDDPAVALRRAEAGDYRESFRYLAPQPDDYE